MPVKAEPSKVSLLPITVTVMTKNANWLQNMESQTFLDLNRGNNRQRYPTQEIEQHGTIVLILSRY